MSCNIKKVMALFGVVLLLGLVAAACVPTDVQDAIRATQADVKSVKADIAALKGDASGKLDKVLAGDSDINQAERDTKEHVVRGRADFIAFNDNFDKMSKSLSGSMTTIVGIPAKKDAKTGATTPAKPGLVQNIDGKLDQLIGIPAKAAVAAKEDPKTGKAIAAIPGVPAKPGLLDDVNAKLDKLVGITAKPAVPAKTDKAGKVVAPAQPAVPAKPGVVDDIMTQLKDIRERLAKIESAAATPTPAPTATPPATIKP